MTRGSFATGATIWLGGREATILAGDPHRAEVLFKSGEREVADLWALHDAGVVQWQAPSTISTPKPQLTESVEAWAEARRRETIIAPIIDGEQKKTRLLLAAQENGVSPRTVYRWKQEYIAKGLPGLIPDTDNRGGKGGHRLAPARETLLDEVLARAFVRRPGPTQRAAYAEVRRSFAEKNLKPPAFHTVRDRIAVLERQRSTTKARHGAARARATHDTSRGTLPDLLEPLQVVFADNTKLDVILVDSQEHARPIGRPWLTLVEDALTRMVLGYYLSLDDPSYISISMALLMGVSSKQELCERYNIPPAHWPIRGLPVMFRSDNGKDFRCRQLQRVADLYGIELAFSPVRLPHYDGRVERLNGTVNRWFHDVPGTTRSNVAQKGDYNAEKSAVLTLEECNTMLATRIAQYHTTIHRALGKSPLQAYNEDLAAGHGPSRPPLDMTEIRWELLPSIERTIQKDGIALHGIHYTDGVLNTWRRPTRGAPPKFEIKFDPRNLRWVYLVPPEGGAPVAIPCSDRTQGDFSLMELERSKVIAASTRTSPDERDIYQSLTKVKELVESASEKTALGKREIRLAERATNKHRDGTRPAAPPNPVATTEDAADSRSVHSLPPARQTELSTDAPPPPNWGEPVLFARSSRREEP